MNKLFTRVVIGAMLFLSSFAVSAQVCKISNNGDTVEAMSALFASDNKSVIVSLANDSSDAAANVTVKIEVIYKLGYNTKTATYENKIQVGPQSSIDLKIPISDSLGSYKPESVRVLSVTGGKCL